MLKDRETEQQLYTILDDSVLMGAVIAEATKKVDERLKRREDRWRAIVTLGVLALGVIGYGTLSSQVTTRTSSQVTAQFARVEESLADTVQDKVDASVETRISSRLEDVESLIFARLDDVDKRMENSLVEMQSDVYAVQLIGLVTKMELSDGISAGERDAALDLLQRATSSSLIFERTEFIVAVETLLDNFAATESAEHILILDRKYREIISRQSGMVITMNVFLAQWLIGSVSPSGEVSEAFRHYSQVAMRTGQQAVAVPFLMVSAAPELNEEAVKVVQEYAKDIEAVGGDELDLMINSLAFHQTDAYGSQSTMTKRVNERFKKFWIDFSEYFPEVTRNMVDQRLSMINGLGGEIGFSILDDTL